MVTKGHISTKAFDLINWEVVEEAMRSIIFRNEMKPMKFASNFCGTVKMMKIMGVWPSDLCPYFHWETETTLHVLKFKHPYMIDTCNKLIHSLNTTLKQLDTEPPLIKSYVNYFRGK